MELRGPVQSENVETPVQKWLWFQDNSSRALNQIQGPSMSRALFNYTGFPPWLESKFLPDGHWDQQH